MQGGCAQLSVVTVRRTHKPNPRFENLSSLCTDSGSEKDYHCLVRAINHLPEATEQFCVQRHPGRPKP